MSLTPKWVHCRDLSAVNSEPDGLFVKVYEADAVQRVLELLREVVNAGVEFEDPRISYKTIQVDTSWFEAAREALRQEARTPGPLEPPEG